MLPFQYVLLCSTKNCVDNILFTFFSSHSSPGSSSTCPSVILILYQVPPLSLKSWHPMNSPRVTSSKLLASTTIHMLMVLFQVYIFGQLTSLNPKFNQHLALPPHTPNLTLFLDSLSEKHHPPPCPLSWKSGS